MQNPHRDGGGRARRGLRGLRPHQAAASTWTRPRRTRCCPRPPQLLPRGRFLLPAPCKRSGTTSSSTARRTARCTSAAGRLPTSTRTSWARASTWRGAGRGCFKSRLIPYHLSPVTTHDAACLVHNYFIIRICKIHTHAKVASLA